MPSLHMGKLRQGESEVTSPGHRNNRRWGQNVNPVTWGGVGGYGQPGAQHRPFRSAEGARVQGPLRPCLWGGPWTALLHTGFGVSE